MNAETYRESPRYDAHQTPPPQNKPDACKYCGNNAYIAPGLELIETKVAAQEKYNEAIKLRNLGILAFLGVLITAVMRGIGQGAVAVIVIGFIMFFVARSHKLMEYLDQKYGLTPRGKAKMGAQK